ncbi:MAG: nitroreductase family protein [archaeon]
MDVKKAILETRSVRKYKPGKVSEELLMELIDAARLAPSGNNAQPWKFRIMANEADKKLLKDNKIFKQGFVYDAPAVILCCADPGAYPAEKFDAGTDDPNILRAVRDLSFAAQNLVLRATELGLGTCYIGSMDKQKIKELLGLPERYVDPYFIAVGYAADKPSKKNRKMMDEILVRA